MEIAMPVSAIPPTAGEIFSKIVTGTEIIENETKTLGFIDVMGGAKLTIRNVDFTTGVTDSASSVQVYGNGELVVDNCKFTHIDNGNGFQLADHNKDSSGGGGGCFIATLKYW